MGRVRSTGNNPDFEFNHQLPAKDLGRVSQPTSVPGHEEADQGQGLCPGQANGKS